MKGETKSLRGRAQDEGAAPRGRAGHSTKTRPLAHEQTKTSPDEGRANLSAAGVEWPARARQQNGHEERKKKEDPRQKGRGLLPY